MGRGYRYNKARRERLRAQGLCIDCTQPHSSDRLRCRSCGVKHSEKQKRRLQLAPQKHA
jgi:hypothetical protein